MSRRTTGQIRSECKTFGWRDSSCCHLIQLSLTTPMYSTLTTSQSPQRRTGKPGRSPTINPTGCCETVSELHLLHMRSKKLINPFRSQAQPVQLGRLSKAHGPLGIHVGIARLGKWCPLANTLRHLRICHITILTTLARADCSRREIHRLGYKVLVEVRRFLKSCSSNPIRSCPRASTFKTAP